MSFDMNDAEPQKSGELIPDGTFAKITMTIRPGGTDGQSEIDRGLLKASNTPGSDVLMVDAEFTVAEGPHVRRKFWQMFTVSGGKVDEHGVSIGWKISKGSFRAMIDSALGLDPSDMSDATKAKRILPPRQSASCAVWPISTASPSSPRSRSSPATTRATATATSSTVWFCRASQSGAR